MTVNVGHGEQYEDETVWAPCGDFASDPKQLESNSLGGPPPGCPGGGPLSRYTYDVSSPVLESAWSASCRVSG